MAPDGSRKAAMLLTWLGPGTAAELLKEASPETVTRIAAELAYLDATGQGRDQSAAECATEFCALLKQQRTREVRGEDFVKEMLESVAGPQEATALLDQVQEMVLARDPFLQLRSVETREIAAALQGEGAHVASLVLQELPPKKGAELLALLPEEFRAAAVHGMATGEDVTPEARLRVAVVVMSRLRPSGGPAAAETPEEDEQLRKVALILRGLPAEFRDSMIEQMTQADEALSEKVTRLMVTWDDIPRVGGRALQEVLRSSDARKLALALCNADEETTNKIRSNSSERMGAMIEEEASLLSSPKPDEIAAAREQILTALRDMNAVGDLTFEEEQDDA